MSFIIAKVGSSGGAGDPTIGNPVIDGTPDSLLYIDSSGNLAQDTLATRNSTTGATAIARTTQELIFEPLFDGTGVDDLTVDYSSSTAAEPVRFTVEITVGDPTSPNKFSWIDNHGNSGSNTTITPGLGQTLSFGIDISFASATGHDTGDLWDFGAIPSATTGFYTNGDIVGFSLPGSGSKIIASDGSLSFSGSILSDTGYQSGILYADIAGDYFTTALGGANTYNINVQTTGGRGSQMVFRDGIARWAVDDGSTATLQLDGTGLYINDSYYLPLADGSAGQALLSDGAGQAYWGSAGGTPALTDTYIGYGSGSNLLTGSSAFTLTSDPDFITVSLGSVSSGGIFKAISKSGSYTEYGDNYIIHYGGSAPADREFQIQGATGTGTNKVGGDISIVTGQQTGNAASPHMEFKNTRASAVSGSAVAGLETFLYNHDGVTTIGDYGAVVSGTKVVIDDLTQLITVTNVPTHADDSAATTAGLTTGQLYKTTTGGSTFLKIVP